MNVVVNHKTLSTCGRSVPDASYMNADFFGSSWKEKQNQDTRTRVVWAWILVLRITVLGMEQILLRIITHVIELCVGGSGSHRFHSKFL